MKFVTPRGGALNPSRKPQFFEFLWNRGSTYQSTPKIQKNLYVLKRLEGENRNPPPLPILSKSFFNSFFIKLTPAGLRDRIRDDNTAPFNAVGRYVGDLKCFAMHAIQKWVSCKKQLRCSSQTVRRSVLRLFLAEGWPAVELLFLSLVPVLVYIHERSKKFPASHWPWRQIVVRSWK